MALLCAMGALQQKPRAQHFGPFLQHCMIQQLTREQLVAVLHAMAELQLSTTDTQVCTLPSTLFLTCIRYHHY